MVVAASKMNTRMQPSSPTPPVPLGGRGNIKQI
jgi:hypothetical protein